MRKFSDIFFDAGNYLELSNLVDRIYVINAFYAVKIALMHRIDANIAGTAIWVRLTPLADHGWLWVRFLVMDTHVSISLRLPQIIQMSH